MSASKKILIGGPTQTMNYKIGLRGGLAQILLGLLLSAVSCYLQF